MSQVISLDNFGFLAVTGRDATKFMQGYTTCDLEALSDTKSAIGAVCNIKGRMVTSFRCVRLPEGLLFRMDRALVPETMAFLSRYIVFSKAEMSDMSGDLACYGVFGANSRASVLETGNLSHADAHVIRVSDEDRFELWTTTGTVTADTDAAGWWHAEIEDGLAWVTAATKEEFIPQMFDYHSIGAIDFEKGCYLGQEIVARMQYRGNLNRRLHRGRTSGVISIGDDLVARNGKHAGTLVAAIDQDFLAVIQAKDNAAPECFLMSGEPVEICPVQAATAG